MKSVFVFQKQFSDKATFFQIKTKLLSYYVANNSFPFFIPITLAKMMGRL